MIEIVPNAIPHDTAEFLSAVLTHNAVTDPDQLAKTIAECQSIEAALPAPSDNESEPNLCNR